jgi:hypothetical protein
VTVSGCPQGYLTSAANYYLYTWANDNLTALCTQACADALASWEQNVVQKSAGQNVIMEGHWIKAETLVHMYKNGHDLACLRSDSGSWCMYSPLRLSPHVPPAARNPLTNKHRVEKEEWQGQQPAQYADDYCICGWHQP